MIDWVIRSFLDVGAVVASWFVSKDAAGFDVISTMIATLVLAAILCLVIYWQSLVGYWRSRRRSRE
jgi:hypothetical protein